MAPKLRKDITRLPWHRQYYNILVSGLFMAFILGSYAQFVWQIGSSIGEELPIVSYELYWQGFCNYSQ